jgi:hypothetical protein
MLLDQFWIPLPFLQKRSFAGFGRAHPFKYRWGSTLKNLKKMEAGQIYKLKLEPQLKVYLSYVQRPCGHFL